MGWGVRTGEKCDEKPTKPPIYTMADLGRLSVVGAAQGVPASLLLARPPAGTGFKGEATAAHSTTGLRPPSPDKAADVRVSSTVACGSIANSDTFHGKINRELLLILRRLLFRHQSCTSQGRRKTWVGKAGDVRCDIGGEVTEAPSNAQDLRRRQALTAILRGGRKRQRRPSVTSNTITTERLCRLEALAAIWLGTNLFIVNDRHPAEEPVRREHTLHLTLCT